MILPKHLLGKKYMVQGVPGTRYYVEPNDIPTYSQFAVVGTEDNTNVVVTPKVQLRCVNRNNAVVPVGEKIGLEDTSKITLGFGFYSSEVMGYGLGIDYAMLPSGALGTAHQIAVRIQF